MNKNRKEKVWKKHIKVIILICTVSVIGVTILSFGKINIIQRPRDNDFYFNMITLNSIITGFSFTNIGLLLTAASSEVVRKISKTGIMKRKNEKLMASVTYSVVTMFISLPYVIDSGIIMNRFFPLAFINIVADGMYLAMIILMIWGMVCFIKSITEISDLLDLVYRDRSKLTQNEINELKKELKSGESKVNI